MRFTAVIACLGLLASSAPGQAGPLPPDSVIRAILKARVDARMSAGIVVGVIDPTGARRVVSFGSSGTSRPLDGNSVFEIASITKTFTAAVLADMATHHELSIDDDVNHFLPGTMKAPGRSGRQITLLDLATHSSGLPPYPTNFGPHDPANPFVDYTADQLAAFLPNYTLPRDIGSRYEYSNLGVGLLGYALTHAAGNDLETLYRRRLLEPLKMYDTRVTPSVSMRERLALGHNLGGEVVPNWDTGLLAGAFALKSTAADMLTWIGANLAADVESNIPLLALSLHTTHVSRRPTTIPATTVGLAWHIVTRNGHVIVWHNGKSGGYSSFAGFDASSRVGVVVLSNSAASIDDIGFHLLLPASPLIPVVPARGEIPLTPAVLDRYVGEYELIPTLHIVVTREGSQLFLQATGQGRLPVFASSEGEFFYKSVDAQVSFEVDASSRTTALVLHQNGANTRGAKIR